MKSNKDIDTIKIEQHIESKHPIKEVDLHKWMFSNNLETLALLTHVFEKYFKLIEKMPQKEEILAFYRRFFYKCFVEKCKDGEYVSNHYTEGNNLVGWYKYLKKDDEIPKEELINIKEMLKKLYLEGDDEIKSAVVCGVLEHLFEDLEIVKDFSDWERKPKLKKAYNEAIEWGKDYWERNKKKEKKRKKKKIRKRK